MEKWDLYDRNGQRLDIQINRGETLPEGTYHRVVHIWILNERKEYLIQKRAAHLSWHPNKWATTTGSVEAGEYNIIEAAYRELSEELALDSSKIDIEFVKEIVIGTSIVTILKGFLPLFMIQQLILNNEVSEVMWAKKDKINILRAEEQFATYSEETFEIAFGLKVE
jgi:8-oxo-dGTP diphosphatase